MYLSSKYPAVSSSHFILPWHLNYCNSKFLSFLAAGLLLLLLLLLQLLCVHYFVSYIQLYVRILVYVVPAILRPLSLKHCVGPYLYLRHISPASLFEGCLMPKWTIWLYTQYSFMIERALFCVIIGTSHTTSMTTNKPRQNQSPVLSGVCFV